MAEGKGTHTAEQEEEPKKQPPWWKRLWARTGFGDKTLWDLLQLFIVPVVLVGIGLLFEMQQAEREERRAEAERKLAEQRAQDEALQAYLNEMSGLLLNEKLRASEEDGEVRTLAWARTLTVLERLGHPSRKTAVMEFLVEAELVQVNRCDEGESGPIIGLSDADLHEANLLHANLSHAVLSGANLSGTSGVTEAQLEEQAKTLEDATMPDGSKHP
jgi:hypothetical protein